MSALILSSRWGAWGAPSVLLPRFGVVFRAPLGHSFGSLLSHLGFLFAYLGCSYGALLVLFGCSYGTLLGTSALLFGVSWALSWYTAGGLLVHFGALWCPWVASWKPVSFFSHGSLVLPWL